MIFPLYALILLVLFNFSNAFVASTQSLKMSNRLNLQMSGKMSKFGIFSPAVYAAKLALGETKLNKVIVNLIEI